MHVPMTKDEIASFLELSRCEVELLWQNGLLQRSLCCADRPVPALNCSTVYDVLEYALAAGVLPVRLSKQVAALWVLQLAEADTWDRFTSSDFGTRVCMMVETAVEDGLSTMTPEPGKVAAVVLGAQFSLLELCNTLRIAS